MAAQSIEDYMHLPRPDTVWVWKGIVPTSGSMLIFGDPKVGKSKLILSLAEAIADPSINQFLGLDIQEHGRVLYLQLDTPRNLWNGYLNVIKSEMARKNIFIIDREMPELPKGFDIRLPQCMDFIRREVDVVKPSMVIVDTLRRMHKGDENDSTIMAHVHDCFVNATSPAALAYITHKKKMQHGEVGDGSARGSSALMGAVDGLLNMRKDKLVIEARSDVAEEIRIFQQQDGTFQVNSRADDVAAFMDGLSKDMPSRQQDEAIAAEFKVTSRTARSWRLGKNS